MPERGWPMKPDFPSPPASALASLHTWFAATPEAALLERIERLRRLAGVRHVAVMPDVHEAPGVCVGTVFATSGVLYPAAIGGDLGCGMAALGFDAPADAVDEPAVADDLLRHLERLVPIRRQVDPLPVRLRARPRASDPRLDRALAEARPQLGTLGGGNHFLELQRCREDGRLWLMVHSGSRGFGQAVARFHAGGPPGSAALCGVAAGSDAGRAFLHDLALARAWARWNRGWMVRAVAWLLKERLGICPRPGSFVQCDHNHVRRERHGGAWLWVHRKGAAPAKAGVAGLIPGSAGTASFHTVGRGCALSLCSSSHGAGRALSRGAARERVTRAQQRRAMAGVHARWAATRRGREESPHAYRPIEQVMRAQRDLIAVRRELQPVISHRAR